MPFQLTICGTCDDRALSCSVSFAQVLDWLITFSAPCFRRTWKGSGRDAIWTIFLVLGTLVSASFAHCGRFCLQHVYEEDETDLTSSGMPKKDAKQQPSMPTESYEDEILPRYKEAISIAWAAFQRRARRDDDYRSFRPGSRSKRVRICRSLCPLRKFGS